MHNLGFAETRSSERRTCVPKLNLIVFGYKAKISEAGCSSTTRCRYDTHSNYITTTYWVRHSTFPDHSMRDTEIFFLFYPNETEEESFKSVGLNSKLRHLKSIVK